MKDKSGPVKRTPTGDKCSVTSGALNQPPGPGSAPDEEYELKIKKLRFELGWGGSFEGFKAVGSIIAALGVIGTLALAFYQQGQTRVSRDDERFDRAVSRVGSSQLSERLTGLAGLQQFLVSKDAEREKSALFYLVNAATIESDPTVRSAMLDTFNSLQGLSLAPAALSAAMSSARDRNRALFKRLLARPLTATRTTPSFNSDFPELAMEQIDGQEKDQLLATAGLMAALVRAGAKVDDLSHTFCMDCVFSAPGLPNARRENPDKALPLMRKQRSRSQSVFAMQKSDWKQDAKNKRRQRFGDDFGAFTDSLGHSLTISLV